MGTLRPAGDPVAGLCARGQALASAGRAAEAPTASPTPLEPEPIASTPARGSPSTRLSPRERARIETNLARGGLWQVAGRTTGDGWAVPTAAVDEERAG